MSFPQHNFVQIIGGQAQWRFDRVLRGGKSRTKQVHSKYTRRRKYNTVPPATWTSSKRATTGQHTLEETSPPPRPPPAPTPPPTLLPEHNDRNCMTKLRSVGGSLAVAHDRVPRSKDTDTDRGALTANASCRRHQKIKFDLPPPEQVQKFVSSDKQTNACASCGRGHQ